MTNKKLVLPVTFTDTTLPKLREDPVLPDAGALALFELAHPSNPVVGVPANGVTIPNIALIQAQALYPAGTSTTLAANMSIGAGFDAGGGLRERSVKGGLHLGYPTTAVSDAAKIANLVLNADVRAYINANLGHSFYTSMWGRITRAGKNSTGGVSRAAIGTSFNVAQFYGRPTGSAGGNAIYPIDSRKVGARADGAVGTGATDGTNKTDTGPFIQTEAVSTVSAAVTSGLFGQAGDISSGAAAGDKRFAAIIFYRLYIEDLTVSGRSHATLDALDFAEYTKQVLTAGGRYYGDTYTAPPA